MLLVYIVTYTYYYTCIYIYIYIYIYTHIYYSMTNLIGQEETWVANLKLHLQQEARHKK